MFKLVLILLAGLVCEAVGVVYLSRGLKEAGAPDPVTLANVLKFIPRAASNGHLWLGIALEAAFFGTLVFLLSRGDVSFIWPLTSLGLVLTTLAAKFILQEEISVARWAGLILIVVGSALITASEKSKDRSAVATAPVETSVGSDRP
jgi:drug/metabolite transporter (DMT)-like permease